MLLPEGPPNSQGIDMDIFDMVLVTLTEGLR
jgi:hypothetical protein